MILLTLALLPVPGFYASANDQPNVLFNLIDDFGWNDVGYNGSAFYETPKMDELSKEWMRFDNCYTPSPMPGQRDPRRRLQTDP
ncbi:sulfatase-like hydrolase/transferase [Novipirellula sp. SH528]|uniref:sulfatase-like hydrolase/transferase n=1 Tax=Novipirellula sp. SH528 TaxID=3454466 RepID=UPI003F9F181F